MSLFWVILLTAASVFGGTSLCFYLLFQARESDSTLWILEHIICPVIRIIVLLVVVSLVYPAIDASSTSADFWRALGQQNQFRNLVNILFFFGLLISFVPLLNHPAFALPLQSILTIALVFHWQYSATMATLVLFPSMATIVKIVAYMLLAYFGTHQMSIPLSRWLDQKLTVAGSIRLVSDTVYMVLQIPVMLIYCSFLKQQLG